MFNRDLSRKTLLALSAAFAIGSSLADDTEIFNSNPSLAATVSSPNVLIILDNTSNWGNGANPQPFTDEKAAMTTVVGALAGMGIKANVGLMFQAAGATDGGYVRFAIRPMLEASGNATTANTRLTALVNALDSGNDKANNPTYAQTMAEAFYYFKGLTPRAGFGDIHRDCGATNSNNTYAAGLGDYGYTGCGTASPNNTNQFTDPANSAGLTYVSPLSTTDSCQKNYIIYISNGPISNNDGQVEAASNNPGYVLLRDSPASASSGQLATIPASPDTETRVNYADEWARYLNQTDLSSTLDGKQNVITYTINVRPGATGQGPAHSAMMNSMALSGGGRPFSAVTQADIEEALMSIFNEIQSKNSVFAAVSLPVSVNVRGINANQVYVGMFRPDPDSLPRWPGNLKLYRLGVNNNNLVLSDQRTTDPANVATEELSIGANGQFADDAWSFWTTPSSFWSFNTSVGPTTSATPASDKPDGPVVEKGGVAEVLRNAYASSQSARKVFTCISTCTTSACNACTASTALTTANSSTNFASGSTYSGATMQSVFGGSALGISSDTALTNLVNWIRGADNALSPGGENNNGSLTDIRASIHADVLHSRPIVINYGGDTAADNDVVIFYGANDGLLRAVKGGYSTVSSAGAATNGIAPGSEMWSFVAPEFFSKFVRQRDNSPAVTSESGLVTNTYGSLTTTSGSATVTGLTTAQTVTLARGMTVAGSGIPGDTYILGVGSTAITMSRNATSSSSSASLTFTPNPKDYFFDGPIGVYVKDVTSSANAVPNGVIRASETDQVTLFVPMRRGGRWLYAFDVTTPTAPVFKWRIGCDNQGSCFGSGIDSEFGQTWSEPKVVKIRINDTTSTGCSVATPCTDKYVIVMGAGYDANVEDRDPIPEPLPSGVSRTQGRGIYVLDIANGNVLWKATQGNTFTNSASLATVPGMIYAIPSDITVIDRNGDGYADRAYVGDTGGNVWRVDMADADRANWRVNKFASIGRSQYLNDSSLLVAPANGENNDINGNTRKFLSPPDVVPASGYDAILIGSGDREHPFNGYGDAKHPTSQAVQNRYYMFKDFDVGTYACNGGLGGIYDTSAFTCATDAVLHETQLADVTSAASASLASLKGWFISLGLGEKLTGSSVTLSGSTFFNTNIPTPPAAGVCTSNLGQARQYAVNYLSGGAAYDRDGNSTVDFAGDRYSAINDGGFLPSPVGLIVSIGGKLYQGIASGPNIQTPGGLKIGDRIKSYWRKRID